MIHQVVVSGIKVCLLRLFASLLLLFGGVDDVLEEVPVADILVELVDLVSYLLLHLNQIL